jgi:hypothetical protein
MIRSMFIRASVGTCSNFIGYIRMTFRTTFDRLNRDGPNDHPVGRKRVFLWQMTRKTIAFFGIRRRFRSIKVQRSCKLVDVVAVATRLANAYFVNLGRQQGRSLPIPQKDIFTSPDRNLQ